MGGIEGGGCGSLARSKGNMGKGTADETGREKKKKLFKRARQWNSADLKLPQEKNPATSPGNVGNLPDRRQQVQREGLKPSEPTNFC